MAYVNGNEHGSSGYGDDYEPSNYDGDVCPVCHWENMGCICPELCMLCGREMNANFDGVLFCSDQCEKLHSKRLLKLKAMIDVKYEPGYIKQIIWSDEDREYILVYGDNHNALIGNFEQAYNFMKP